MSNKTQRTVLVLGATGLVGSHLIRQLTNDPTIGTINILTRRPLGFNVPSLKEYVVDFEALPEKSDMFVCDDVFIAFGTTIAKAGSQTQFRKIDLEIPLGVTTKAKAHGAINCFLVSSVGADPQSGIFYNKTKGELEFAITGLDYSSFYIFRPSILLGQRGERRVSESIGIYIGQFFRWIKSDLLGIYSGMPADVLAQSMVAAASHPELGKHVLHFREIVNLIKAHE